MGTPHDEADFSNSLVGRMGVSPNDEKVKIDVYMVKKYESDVCMFKETSGKPFWVGTSRR